MYQAYAFLRLDTDFTLDAAAQKLAAKFPALSQEKEENRLRLSSPTWEIHLKVVEGALVQQEARDIAQHIGGTEDELGLGTCTRCVQVASDVPDPEMEHFNDYLLVIEVLQSFRGVIAVDPKEPSLL